MLEKVKEKVVYFLFLCGSCIFFTQKYFLLCNDEKIEQQPYHQFCCFVCQQEIFSFFEKKLKIHVKVHSQPSAFPI